MTPPGRVYGDKEKTPVPHPANRCTSHCVEHRDGARELTLSHPCKLAKDHDGPHRCVCGKAWERLEEVLT